MNTQDFIIKIKNFLNLLDNEDKNFNTNWIAGDTIGVDKNILINESILNNISYNKLTFGTNLEEYHTLSYWTNDNIIKHHNIHSNLLSELTDINIHHLKFKNVLDFPGVKLYDDYVLIPPVYRFGYYLYQIKSKLKEIKSKSNRLQLENTTILEIGGGWGGLCNIILNNIPNVKYIIVDIPTTIINSSFILSKLGKKVTFLNEMDLDTALNDKNIDVIMITPSQLNQIKSVDIIVSSACLHELNNQTIDYYFDFIQSKCNYFTYIDYEPKDGKYIVDKYFNGNKNISLHNKSFHYLIGCPNPNNYYTNEIILDYSN